MRRHLVLFVFALLPLTAAAAPSKGASAKPGDGCSALSERRLELGRELELLDATIGEKRTAIADASKVETIVELGGENEGTTIVDLATPTATPAMTSEAALKKIEKLQLELIDLEPKRDDLARKLARVRSTITQGCPAK